MSQKVRVEIDVTGERVIAGGTSKGVSRIVERLQAIYTFPQGTANGASDTLWADDRTVVAGVVDSLELDNLPAGGPAGPATLSKVKGLVIFNDSAADYLTVGGGGGGRTAPAANAWSDTAVGVTLSPFNVDADSFAIAAGDYFLWTSKAGVPVVTITGDVLGIEAFVSNQDYKILVWGDD